MAITHTQIKNLMKSREKVIIFEVGCADGRDTKTFLNTFGKELTIYTFDPEPINIRALTNLGQTDAMGGNNDQLVTDERHIFHPYAMCDRKGTIIFNRSRDIGWPDGGKNIGRYSGSIHRPVTHLQSDKYGSRWPKTVFEETVEAECTSVDIFCEENDIDHIDFLWMDTQGAEREVLKGAQRMLSKTDYVYTEYYDEEMYKNCAGLEEIQSLLPNYVLEHNWRCGDADGGDVLLKGV